MAEALSVTYTTPLSGTPVGAFFRDFDSASKAGVYRRVGTALRLLFKAKMRENQTTRHKTADSFTPPAKPTKYWSKARVAWKADASGAEVSVAAPGITRALHDLHIHAKGKLLTIPARPSPEAYGKRARELSEKLFFIKTPSGVRMLATPTKATEGGKPYISKPHRVERDRIRRGKRADPDKERKFRPVYWLRESVTVPKDETILPSKDEITDTATRTIEVAVRDFVLGRK